VVPPKDVVAFLRKAGVKRAPVSSSGDEGTQKLLAEGASLPPGPGRAHPLGARRLRPP